MNKWLENMTPDIIRYGWQQSPWAMIMLGFSMVMTTVAVFDLVFG